MEVLAIASVVGDEQSLCSYPYNHTMTKTSHSRGVLKYISNDMEE